MLSVSKAHLKPVKCRDNHINDAGYTSKVKASTLFSYFILKQVCGSVFTVFLGKKKSAETRLLNMTINVYYWLNRIQLQG